jgi:hypothetical protein
MNCTELETILHEFVDNELARDKRNEVANHLASCRRCAVKVAEFEQADRQLKRMVVVEPPDDFLQNVRRRITEAGREEVLAGAPASEGGGSRESFWEKLDRKLTLPWWVKVPLGAAAAFGIALAVFVAIQFVREEQQRREWAEWVEGDNGSAPPPPSRVDSLPSESLTTVAKEPAATAEGVGAEDLKPHGAPTDLEVPTKLELAAKGPPPDDAAAMTLLSPAAAPPPVEEGMGTEAVRTARGPAEAPTLQPKPETLATGAPSLTNPSTSVAVAMPAPPDLRAPGAPPSRTTERPTKAAPREFAKATVPPLTNRPPPLQSGWLDLGTRIFYAKPETDFALGGYVRGRLDERDRLTLTSTQVEGMIELLDAKQAAARGTHGWLELTSLRFVASRPGFVPSYPYIEGYQDEQGEFHPISRRIYRAGD